MKFSTFALSFLACLCNAHPFKREINGTQLSNDIPPTTANDLHSSYGKPFAIYQPKAFIVSMFELERDPWLKELDFVHNITLPGLSPAYPTLYCSTNYTICQITTGEGEINAASTITALTLNPLFDLSKTYFLIAGIAGGEPAYTTLGGVTFAKYAVQLALEYEVDYVDYHNTMPNWTTGYYAYGTHDQNEYPGNVYGTEVFEVNEQLRDRAVELASRAELNNGTEQNAKFRSLYNQTAARSLPAIAKCDVATSDVYFYGATLNNYFSSFASMMTNGSAVYCASAQEDNASLEAFVRAQKFGLVDYDRIVVMRTISDFARPPPLMDNNTVGFFNQADQGGIQASLDNLVKAGLPFIHDILAEWDSVYDSGDKYRSKNYVGDIFGTLGGTPDFGKPNFDVA
ncbi:purine nucleoside permease [Suhomyces tanzawaensis NRRL Y-17324]|uniref:Purine nucleoside permease n=1 Tax=Suhomyces tanzawaensis NRRL Y-17324 TaxID=984487 RepID=A0A1E4SHZ6_9ASCO|nr:purine nucleoside permease [Suhomyces tanzawaensis NRRL Y-17324]ODV79067.1 purine nucleoside permease [Suhomyces tanzawaensis NRRL Y-17324]